MQPDEEVIYNFATELLDTKQVSEATFAAAKEKFGERGVVDLVGVLGYYSFVSMVLNVDRYPVAPGVTPELKPLKLAAVNYVVAQVTPRLLSRGCTGHLAHERHEVTFGIVERNPSTDHKSAFVRLRVVRLANRTPLSLSCRCALAISGTVK